MRQWGTSERLSNETNLKNKPHMCPFQLGLHVVWTQQRKGRVGAGLHRFFYIFFHHVFY